MRRFFECVENGSKDDLKEIQEIFDNDDSRFFLTFLYLLFSYYRYVYCATDPEHIINRTNVHGETPLYIAARNANLRV